MIITLNKNFYNLKSVKKVIEEFREFADFKIKKENNKVFKISIENMNKKVKGTIEDEFCNHVLAEMKK